MGAATVVVLNWNGEAYIRDCLRSVLAQTYATYRVIVVDNASTDGSREIIRDEFPEAALVALPENLHFARGTNAGMEVALRDPECTYVVTLNNDTRVDPEWLAELVRAANPARIGTVASKLVFMDRPGVINSAGILIAPDGNGVDRGWLQKDEGQFDDAVDVFGASAGAALYRRGALETVGLFDGDFVAYFEDLDLAWRLRLAGWEGRFAPRSVVHHKYSASVGFKSAWKTYQGERNRIWNLLMNYPWAYVAGGESWNAVRLLEALARRGLGRRAAGAEAGPGFRELVDARVRGRLDAYAGLRGALAKRRSRAGYRTVGARSVGQWLRKYGAAIRDMPRD